MFEIRPELVVFPKDSADVQSLIKLVGEKKNQLPNYLLRPAVPVLDMAGGAINDSIIVDFNRHFTKIEKVTPTEAQTQPGVFYRDFEKETLKQHALMPSYPASRELCTVGGMVANNSGGEKSLEFGRSRIS